MKVVLDLKRWNLRAVTAWASSSASSASSPASGASAREVKPGGWHHCRLINGPRATKVGGRKSSLCREHSVLILIQTRTSTFQNMWHFVRKQVQVRNPSLVITVLKAEGPLITWGQSSNGKGNRDAATRDSALLSVATVPAVCVCYCEIWS